ncbi:hypothetical protein ASC61_03750 [Aeromicrobium sp. Root344]|uniref:DUF4190 domain-containing protein n=1 Tax=Aeromicrobium sp. Root344 TaxID=1736521 RepID=UPI0006FE8359|nr:DUF4190 domain-containing protein [Aeromicrobium sp. Root344]KQV74194.1 hypothetical protein ASC61_03750 [Aeromicrobium sp. Root344]
MTTPYPYPPQQPYPYALRPALLPKPPRSTAALVLGIVGVAGFFLLLAPIALSPLAWYFGAVAQREAEREPTRYRHAGEAKAGMVLGIIGSAILGVVLLLLVVAATLTVIGVNHDAGYGS